MNWPRNGDSKDTGTGSSKISKTENFKITKINFINNSIDKAQRKIGVNEVKYLKSKPVEVKQHNRKAVWLNGLNNEVQRTDEGQDNGNRWKARQIPGPCLRIEKCCGISRWRCYESQLVPLEWSSRRKKEKELNVLEIRWRIKTI